VVFSQHVGNRAGLRFVVPQGAGGKPAKRLSSGTGEAGRQPISPAGIARDLTRLEGPGLQFARCSFSAALI
jgi:hypothetical protein